MKLIKIGLFFLIVMIVLKGCIKIPIGDGNSLKLSKDGITVSDADGKESTLNIDKDDDSSSLSVDGEDAWAGSFGENVALPANFPVAELPIPKETNIISAHTTNIDEADGLIVIYTYEGEIEPLSKMYVDNFNSKWY